MGKENKYMKLILVKKIILNSLINKDTMIFLAKFISFEDKIVSNFELSGSITYFLQFYV